MGKFSKIFYHIESKDLKNKYEQKKAAKIQEEKRKEDIKKYISTEMINKQSNWRDTLKFDSKLIEKKLSHSHSIIEDIKKIVKEGMTTSDIATLSIEKSDDPVSTTDPTIDASYQGMDNYFFVGDTSGENPFNGTRIRASGSGSGNSGGFNVGGSYLAFDQVGSSGGASGLRHAILAPIDCSEIDTITITAIVGDDSNGGSPPNNPNQVGNEALSLMYHHGNMRFATGMGFLPCIPGQPDDGRPEGFSLAQSLVYGDIIPVGGSKGSGLHQYSVPIPQWARSQSTTFSFSMLSSGTFDNIGITDIKFERKAPMNVVVTLDDPKASSFIRGAEQGSTPQSRKKRVRGILKSSDKYSNKFLGKDFPGTGSDLSDTNFPDKDIEQMQQQNRDETKDHIGDQFTDNQIADILNKLGNPPEEVSSDPKDYDMTGLDSQAIKLAHFDPRGPVNPEGGYTARLQAAKEALSAAMEAEFNRSLYTRESPNYNNSEIQKLYAAKQESEKALEGWQTFKANNNWKYIGPDIGAEPEPVENEMTDAQREKVIAELDKDIAKYSAEEQAAYDEMKRIALEFGMDVVSLVGGLFSGGTTLASSPTLSKLLLKLAKKSGKGLFGKLVRKVLRKTQKSDAYTPDEISDFVNKQSEPDANIPKSPTPKSKVPAGEVGSIDPVTKQPRGGGGADIGLPDIKPSKPKVKLGKDGKVELPDIPELKKKPFKESTLLERLKSKGFFNPDDIKPTFPENPPPELDPVTQMHPNYGKRSARYKKLDPASANAMPATGDPETDAIVDKQRTKSKPKDYLKMFNKIKKFRNK